MPVWIIRATSKSRPIYKSIYVINSRGFRGLYPRAFPSQICLEGSYRVDKTTQSVKFLSVLFFWFKYPLRRFQWPFQVKNKATITFVVLLYVGPTNTLKSCMKDLMLKLRTTMMTISGKKWLWLAAFDSFNFYEAVECINWTYKLTAWRPRECKSNKSKSWQMSNKMAWRHPEDCQEKLDEDWHSEVDEIKLIRRRRKYFTMKTLFSTWL